MHASSACRSGSPITLSDEVPYSPAPEMTLEQALDRAYKTRPDYQGALERIRAAVREYLGVSR